MHVGLKESDKIAQFKCTIYFCKILEVTNFMRIYLFVPELLQAY
jgi:hypothetical protein